MRVRSVVSSIGSVFLLLPLAAGSVFAQAAGAAAKPVPVQPAAAPAAQPVVAAPVVAPPAAAVAAPAVPVAGAAAAPDAFSLTDALSAGVPMSADDVAKRAVRTSPSVEKAEKNAQKSAAAAEQADLSVYPRLELEARYTRLSDTGPGPFKFMGANVVFPQIRLNQGLFEARLVYPVSALFFSVLPRYRAAMAAADAQKIQVKVQEQTIASMAKEAYYNYARSRATLMVARAALAQAEAHRRDVDALVSSGTVARVELMRADAQVAAARVAVSRVEGSVAVARVSICALLHMEVTDIHVDENLETVLPALANDQSGYLALALQNRSEVKSLRTLSDAQDKQIEALQGDRLPKLNVGGTVDLSDPNQRWSSYDNKWYASWAAYASLTWSPNDYAFAGKGIDQTRADLAGILSDLENIEDALRTEVARAVEDYNAARAAMESALTGIAAAEESYRVRREQFRAGAATATDVIDAESELRTARMDLVNASIDGRISKARLDRSIEAN